MESIDTNQYTVTKTQVECYKFRHESGMYWADITIDTALGAKIGRISIASDFGNWQNYWNACGPSFKEFLANINMEYAADKFGADAHFNPVSTTEAYRTCLKDNYDVNDEEFLKVLAEISALEHCSGENEFIIRIGSSPHILKMYDGCPQIDRGIKPQFVRFWNAIWPLLLAELKKEETPKP